MNLKFIFQNVRYGYKCKKQGKDNETWMNVKFSPSTTTIHRPEEIKEEKEEILEFQITKFFQQ